MSNRDLRRARMALSQTVRARMLAREEGYSAKRQATAERRERAHRRAYLEALRADDADSLAWEA